MNPSQTSAGVSNERFRWRKIASLGTVCGALAALGYTATNICLRQVAHCDPIWVSCVKAATTAAAIAPWLAVRAWRSQAIAPNFQFMKILLPAAAFSQLAGNGLFQWSLGVVGLALAVPLTLGTLIVAGALLGRFYLAEPVTGRTGLAVALLVAAMFILSLGAADAHRSVSAASGADQGVMVLAAGVLAACIAGAAYAVLNVAVRHSLHAGAPRSTTVVTVGLVGVLVLGVLSYVRLGNEFWRTPANDLQVMVMAGACNAAAFFALTAALRLASVVYVNALNASQVAMATLAGVLLFREAVTLPLACGVALTALGLLLFKSRSRAAPPEDEDHSAAGRPEPANPMAAEFPPLEPSRAAPIEKSGLTGCKRRNLLCCKYFAPRR